tara:strand:+ start:182 stop:577 length:396 start_codon:yes stop_codon:yes gene_type:complete
MLSAPSIRFGSGIFILIISSYSLFFSDLRFPKLDKLFSQKSMLLLLVFLTVFSTPLFDNYKNVESNIELRKIEPMYLVYEKNLNNWGEQVKNIDGQDIEFCWINKNCIPPNNNRIEEFDMFSYRVMKVVNK